MRLGFSGISLAAPKCNHTKDTAPNQAGRRLAMGMTLADDVVRANVA